jgi:hypothetical protein
MYVLFAKGGFRRRSMRYFTNSVTTEKELKTEYHRLAKIYHSDLGGDDARFRELTSEYIKLKASLIEPIIDLHERARIISEAAKEILEPLDKIKYGIILRGTGIDVIIARQCGMKRFLQAFDALEELKKELGLDIVVYAGHLVKDDLRVLYPCTRSYGWVYMGKGKRPTNLADKESESHKSYKLFGSDKHAWAFSLKQGDSYMIEGTIQELKKML